METLGDKKLPRPGLRVRLDPGAVLAASWRSSAPQSWRLSHCQTICIIIIFFISGLTLKTADIKNALGAHASLAYGIVAILLATPMFGFALVQIPFEPVQFRYGLALFSCVPTT